MSIVFFCTVVDWLSGLWVDLFLKLHSFYSGNTDKSKRCVSQMGVVGPSQCLLVLEFKMCCQKFPNVSYALSRSPSEPISLVFYWKYWWKKQNKCSFDRKHIAGKSWGYFSNPGLPPLSLSVSVLASGSCWQYSSCNVPLFHLMLKYEPRTCCGEYQVQAIIQAESSVF